MFDLEELQRTGAVRLPHLALPLLSAIEAVTRDLPAERAGLRLNGQPGLRPLLDHRSLIGQAACHALGADAQPVRALLFDKSERTNWALGWHQDRTICVAERIETPGFGPWTNKQGMVHVAPPESILRDMVTLRIHLDAVPETNAPLLVASGSHRLGRIPERQVAAIIEQSQILTCLAERGDVWLYSTLILHASDAATQPMHRRVLQVDYSALALPNGLEWAGV
ncbi:phytanoyl-CoA dioxygenase family protein [Novosphingobium sp. THN1]|uniref:phytanoyl-CoA dioxygenase family protein n=1 Tax=Novosphingobium sp. THN1 TaxID=1016987 RepID=UPI003513365E